jgi:DNA-binding TFAR19-related protein (PDSD5 family)
MLHVGNELSEDDELAYLKRKKLLEIRKRLLVEKAAETKQAGKKERKKPREILTMIFAESAWEIWQAAELQYPKTAEAVAKALATLVEAGKIREKITGEQIYWLFKQLGVPVRLKTKIRILEGGELKTIADKLRAK